MRVELGFSDRTKFYFLLPWVKVVLMVSLQLEAQSIDYHISIIQERSLRLG